MAACPRSLTAVQHPHPNPPTHPRPLPRWRHRRRHPHGCGCCAGLPQPPGDQPAGRWQRHVQPAGPVDTGGLVWWMGGCVWLHLVQPVQPVPLPCCSPASLTRHPTSAPLPAGSGGAACDHHHLLQPSLCHPESGAGAGAHRPQVRLLCGRVCLLCAMSVGWRGRAVLCLCFQATQHGS